MSKSARRSIPAHYYEPSSSQSSLSDTQPAAPQVSSPSQSSLPNAQPINPQESGSSHSSTPDVELTGNSDVETLNLDDSSESENSPIEVEEDPRTYDCCECNRYRFQDETTTAEYPLIMILNALFRDCVALPFRLFAYAETISGWPVTYIKFLLGLLLGLLVIYASERTDLISQHFYGPLSSFLKSDKLGARSSNITLSSGQIPPVEFNTLAMLQSELVEILDPNGLELSLVLDKEMHSVERVFKWIRGSDLQPYEDIRYTIDSYSGNASQLVSRIGIFDHSVSEDAVNLMDTTLKGQALFSQWNSAWPGQILSLIDYILPVSKKTWGDMTGQEELFRTYLYDLEKTKEVIRYTKDEAGEIHKSVQRLDSLFDTMYRLIARNRKYRRVKKEDLLGQLLQNLELPESRGSRAGTMEEDLVNLKTIQNVHYGLTSYAAGVVMRLEVISSNFEELRNRADGIHKVTESSSEQERSISQAAKSLKKKTYEDLQTRIKIRYRDAGLQRTQGRA